MSMFLNSKNCIPTDNKPLSSSQEPHSVKGKDTWLLCHVQRSGQTADAAVGLVGLSLSFLISN